MTTEQVEVIITPEIDRAILLFNYCFPKLRIKTGFSLNKNALIAVSNNDPIDYDVSQLPNTLDEIIALNNSIRRLYKKGLKAHLKEVATT